MDRSPLPPADRASALAQEANAAADTRLLARLRTGEEAAFEELVRHAGVRLLAVARRMLMCEDDAQDAVQEAFLSAIKGLDAFDGRSRITTWLHRITVNVCLMRLRSARRRPLRPMSDLLPRFLEDGHQATPARPWRPAPSDGLESEEVRSIIRQNVDQLPPDYRAVFILRDIEQLDTRQTADMLGITEAAVKTRLHRARQALRTLLDPYFSDQPVCLPHNRIEDNYSTNNDRGFSTAGSATSSPATPRVPASS